MVVVLTFTGPFGTFVDLSAPLRLAYWAIAIGSCGLLMTVVIGAVTGNTLARGLAGCAAHSAGLDACRLSRRRADRVA